MRHILNPRNDLAGLVAAIALLIKQTAHPESVSAPVDAKEISAH